MADKIVMYLFVNTDLNMSKGKMCSQIGHIVQLLTEEIIRAGYEQHPPPESYFTYIKWKSNCTKIILRATTDQLKELIKLKGARYFIDDGKTQVPENSLTVVGFYPNSDMGDTVKDFKLL